MPQSSIAQDINSPLPKHGERATVLVVEDNPDVRAIVTRQLRDLSYHVLETDNAADALSVLTNTNIDLLFSDIVMPGKINGLELARKATARWPELKIVLTSGFPEKHYVNNPDGEASPVKILAKPYRKQELARVVAEAIEK